MIKIIILIAVAVIAILVYRNNQKKADTIIADVQKDATKVVADVKEVKDKI